MLRKNLTADERASEADIPDLTTFMLDTRGGLRDPCNTRRALRTALSPVGSTARRDLGTTLKTCAAKPT